MDGTGPRELRLEGAFLLLAGGVLLASLVGAFYLGRWVERSVARSPSASTATDPLANVEDEAESTDKLTFFDTLSGEGKTAEPSREVAARSGSGRVPNIPSRSVASPKGPWAVQVFAGRERAAAEVLVRALTSRGHAVRLDSRREGAGALYRVRVGGYATREEAQNLAERLKSEGQGGAWVTQVE